MPFAPDQVTGLTNWWRADDIAQADGSAVASWAARTGGVTMTQATGGAQPLYEVAGLGGQPSVRFNGTSSLLAGSIAAATNQPFTWVIVCFTTTTATTQSVVMDGGGSVTGIELITPNWTGWGGTASLSGGAATTSPTIVTFVATGATSVVYLNGTAGTAGNAGTSPMAIGTLQFGNHPTLTRRFSGDLAEVIFYSHALTATERATVDSYVANRYGITVADYLASPRRPPPDPARYRASTW